MFPVGSSHPQRTTVSAILFPCFYLWWLSSAFATAVAAKEPTETKRHFSLWIWYHLWRPPMCLEPRIDDVLWHPLVLFCVFVLSFSTTVFLPLYFEENNQKKKKKESFFVVSWWLLGTFYDPQPAYMFAIYFPLFSFLNQLWESVSSIPRSWVACLLSYRETRSVFWFIFFRFPVWPIIGRWNFSSISFGLMRQSRWWGHRRGRPEIVTLLHATLREWTLFFLSCRFLILFSCRLVFFIVFNFLLVFWLAPAAFSYLARQFESTTVESERVFISSWLFQ